VTEPIESRFKSDKNNSLENQIIIDVGCCEFNENISLELSQRRSQRSYFLFLLHQGKRKK